MREKKKKKKPILSHLYFFLDNSEIPATSWIYANCQTTYILSYTCDYFSLACVFSFIYLFIYFLFFTDWEFPVNSLQAVPLLDQVIMGWENIVEEGQGQLEWGLLKRVCLSEYCAMIAQTFKVVVGCVRVTIGGGGGVFH